jgi:hypothetical protein
MENKNKKSDEQSYDFLQMQHHKAAFDFKMIG